MHTHVDEKSLVNISMSMPMERLSRSTIIIIITILKKHNRGDLHTPLHSHTHLQGQIADGTIQQSRFYSSETRTLIFTRWTYLR